MTIYGLAIVWVSLRSPDGGEPLFIHIDKLQHFGAYMVYALLSYGFVKSMRSYWLVGVYLFSFGAGIELAQSFTPDRFASVADQIANSLGTAFGLASLAVFNRYRSLETTEHP